MRTTITLEDDVAARLRRLERKSRRAFKDLVNAALRAGLPELEQKPEARDVVLPALDLGDPLVGSLDDVGALLEQAEGDAHR